MEWVVGCGGIRIPEPDRGPARARPGPGMSHDATAFVSHDYLIRFAIRFDLHYYRNCIVPNQTLTTHNIYTMSWPSNLDKPSNTEGGVRLIEVKSHENGPFAYTNDELMTVCFFSSLLLYAHPYPAL